LHIRDGWETVMGPEGTGRLKNSGSLILGIASPDPDWRISNPAGITGIPGMEIPQSWIPELRNGYEPIWGSRFGGVLRSAW